MPVGRNNQADYRFDFAGELKFIDIVQGSVSKPNNCTNRQSVDNSSQFFLADFQNRS
jgi:hypothetical protein